jgi:hypothetical protein
MLGAPNLLARLRIRDRLNGTDLVRYAAAIHERPETAERFEKLLIDNIRLLSSAIVDQLRELPCLRARSGRLATPASLHLDTPTNRLCLGNLDCIMAGGNEPLYRKLRVREVAHSDTLLAVIDAARDRTEPPIRPDLLYPALAAAIARERRSKADLSDRPICWVNGDYHAPTSILVGPRIPPVLDNAIPVFRKSDQVSDAYLALGARGQARDEHWARFFTYVATEWGQSQPLSSAQRRVLLDAYHLRGWQGLPEGLEGVDCLVDCRGYLYSSADVAAGRLVEPDFPLLEDALSNAGSDIGIAARSERSRLFFSKLGIRPLSFIAGTGKPLFGEEATRPLWFKPYHREVLLTMLRKPLFARAMHEIAMSQRHINVGFHPADFLSMKDRLDAVNELAFFGDIEREYDVAGVSARVPVDVAVHINLIGVVAPKTKLDFQHLVAEALAEIAGAVRGNGSIRNFVHGWAV